MGSKMLTVTHRFISYAFDHTPLTTTFQKVQTLIFALQFKSGLSNDI